MVNLYYMGSVAWVILETKMTKNADWAQPFEAFPATIYAAH